MHYIIKDDQGNIIGWGTGNPGSIGGNIEWVETPYEPPLPPLLWTDPALDARYWWIDVGPFLDRFGAKALAVTSSTDPQVQGLITILLPRKYVDLKRADLPAMLDLLISKSLITADDKAAILTTPTTDYERHVKGMRQPS